MPIVAGSDGLAIHGKSCPVDSRAVLPGAFAGTGKRREAYLFIQS